MFRAEKIGLIVLAALLLLLCVILAMRSCGKPDYASQTTPAAPVVNDLAYTDSVALTALDSIHNNADSIKIEVGSKKSKDKKKTKSKTKSKSKTTKPKSTLTPTKRDHLDQPI